MNNIPESKIIVIDADLTLTPTGRKKMGKINVAAYCRVSTDELDQLNSFETQVENYTNLINDNPQYKMAGIFADEGISGKQMDNRPEFVKMMRDCRRGKIDLIFVKSVSRFARNTLDCIDTIRELKRLGVRIVFEKEGIDTDAMNTELFLTIHSAFAQAESESISQNVRMGIRQGYKQGKFTFRYKGFLGYKKGEDGKPQIVELEAEIVRMIYALFLQGESYLSIKNRLEERNIKTASGKEIWSTGAIMRILTNEKYMGDVLLQKTYVADFITGRTKENRGELPKYLIKNNHTPIIDANTFHKAQAEIAERNNKKEVVQSTTVSKRGKHSAKYALTSKVICNECKTPYRRFAWQVHGRKEVVWRCAKKLKLGVKTCPSSPTIKEEALHQAVKQAYHQYLQQAQETAPQLAQEILQLTDENANMQEKMQRLDSITKEITQRNAELDRLVDMITEQVEQSDFLELKISQINNAITALTVEKDRLQQEIQAQEKSNQPNELGQTLLESTSYVQSAEAFSDVLVNRVIKQIMVHENRSLAVTYLDGCVDMVG